MPSDGCHVKGQGLIMVANPGFNCDLVLNCSNVQTLHIVQGQWIAWFPGESELMDEVFVDEITHRPTVQEGAGGSVCLDYVYLNCHVLSQRIRCQRSIY